MWRRLELCVGLAYVAVALAKLWAPAKLLVFVGSLGVRNDVAIAAACCLIGGELVIGVLLTTGWASIYSYALGAAVPLGGIVLQGLGVGRDEDCGCLGDLADGSYVEWVRAAIGCACVALIWREWPRRRVEWYRVRSVWLMVTLLVSLLAGAVVCAGERNAMASFERWTARFGSEVAIVLYEFGCHDCRDALQRLVGEGGPKRIVLVCREGQCAKVVKRVEEIRCVEIESSVWWSWVVGKPPRIVLR